MDIGRAIASACAERKISAAEISRRTGISPSTLSKYKAGTITPPLDALKAIAEVLGCHVYELVARAEGVTLPVTGESVEAREWREKWQALEPEARYVVNRLADMLKKGENG